jgi:hypothetical protein
MSDSSSIVSPNLVTEFEKSAAAISDESIYSVFKVECLQFRMDNFVCVDCKGKCGAKFIQSDFPRAYKELKDFRTKLWFSSDESSLESIRDNRVKNLLDELFQMKNTANCIAFTFGKDKVC